MNTLNWLGLRALSGMHKFSEVGGFEVAYWDSQIQSIGGVRGPLVRHKPTSKRSRLGACNVLLS